MSLFSIFNVSGSAMSAQAQRLNVVASNLANADSATSASGEAYRAKQVVFEATPSANGAGLNPSPSTALDQNTPGYVDYLDTFGNYAGTGATPPGNAEYIRRWSIQPLPTNPNNTLILQVLVTTVATEQSLTGVTTRRRMPGDALIVSVKTRKSQ